MSNPHGLDASRSFASDSAAGLTATRGDPRQRRAGDRVRLMSGGAIMTIQRADHRMPTPFAFCSWMDARDNIHHAHSRLVALEPAIPEDKTAP